MAKVTPNASATTKPAKPAKEKKEKKEKPQLPAYPAIGSKDPNVYPLKEVPTDFDPAKHAPLEKADFAKKSTFLLYRADQLELRVLELREQAKTADQKGNKSGSKLVKMLEKAADMRKELEAAGIDVDALLKATAAAKKTEPAPAAAQ